MSDNLDEDLQGLVKALVVLVLVFGGLALLASVYGPTGMANLLGG